MPCTFLCFQVIDFGSSCYENQRVYTYIQSRFYRAPEVILGARYGMPIDMWSLGCILAELFTGFPLLPGEDEADQLACIIEMLGMPPQRLLQNSKRSRQFISSKGYPKYCTATAMPDGTTVLSGGLSRRGKLRGPPGSRDLEAALRSCADEQFLDFLKNCLVWEPEYRMTPHKALKHPWLRRRCLPRPPGDKNDTLPAVTSATQPVTTGGPALRTSASGSRSSSKTNSLQSGNNTSDDIATSKTTTGQQRNRLVEDVVSSYTGYGSSYVSGSQLHGNNWGGTAAGLNSGHQSLNSVGGGGRSSSSKTNSLQIGSNTTDDIPASKTTSQQRRNRLLAGLNDVVSTYAGYGVSQPHSNTWGTSGGMSSSGHQSLNSISSRSSSKTNSQLQTTASTGDIPGSKTDRQQQRDRASELPVTIFDPYPLNSFSCLSESQLHGNHRANQSSSHQSLNSLDGTTTGKSQRGRQAQQQHNNNSTSHDNYGSHGSSSSSRLVLSLHPAVQEILEELKR